ncbi:Serine/threonine protein kinase [Handroanthus impetiginosus]|uniref:non-specific serine/threonine protein kinase n=1 Tax=Handroanthus impetiginosus TaxID=429701 RepID=A0A2G9H0L7_9LAMI|nr:Serine/threonine protein kinase [Handroanthus impetiginosus]
MNSQTLSWFSFFLLVLFQAYDGSSFSNADGSYQTCGNTFTCGNTITGIGYPFRGLFDPLYCGYPGLVLGCDYQTNITNIYIMKVNYRVLEINQTSQTMRIARMDLMEGTCPQEMMDTTLDNSILDVNITDSSDISCGNDGAYIVPGNQGPGNCNASVVVPGPVTGNGAEGLDKVLQQGFLIRWKIDSKPCSDCTASKGRCGFNFGTNQTACFCSDPPYVFYTCPMTYVAPPTTKPSPVLPIAGAVLAGVVFGWLIFYYRQRGKQRIASESAQGLGKDIATPPSSNGLSSLPSTKFTKSIPSYPSTKSNPSRGSSYFGVQVFDYTELEKATNNFDPSRELGDGGFGVVYHGVLSDDRIVAIKRLYENNFRRAEQFMNEVEILTHLRHRNLVTLYGCTSRRSRELLLVYEYVANGTVAEHLHGKRAKSGLLSWSIRLNIAVETADALAYLHKSDIIHRDVKTNNLLLDNDFHVKVADFGLCRLFPNDVTHVSTAPQGTPGYVDPEYYQCYKLTEKRDVYSFGVVLIELISSLQAVDTNRHRHDINLSSMAINKIQNHMLRELVDKNLGFETNSIVRRMVTLIAELAFRCLQQERDMRPSMEEVLHTLKGIQNEDLNNHKVEIVDILMDEDAGLLRGSTNPPSPDSIVTIK